MPGTCATPRMTEKQLQRAITDAAKLYRWDVYHTTYSIGSDRGYPDLTLVHPEHGVIWCELKTYRGRVSDDQRRWLHRLEAAGQRAWLVYPDDLDALLRVLAGETQTLEETK